jgi:hypothetical protein
MPIVKCFFGLIAHLTHNALRRQYTDKAVGVQCLSVIIGHCTVSVGHHRTLHSVCQSSSYTTQCLSVTIGHSTVSVGHHRTLHSVCQSSSDTTVSVGHHRTLHSVCQSPSDTTQCLSVTIVHCTQTSVITLNITFDENLATGIQSLPSTTNGRKDMTMLTVDYPQLACGRV